jgi:hypothetical protein
MAIAVNSVPSESTPAGRREGAARVLALARTHWPFTVGMATTVLGVLIVVLGWNGAANTTVLQYQLPYIISGGILGVGLIVLGGMYQVGYALWMQQRKLLDALGDTRAQAEHQPVPEAASLVTPLDVVVVPGGASFHREGCRVTVGKANADRISASAAERRGLKPCRLCH